MVNTRLCEAVRLTFYFAVLSMLSLALLKKLRSRQGVQKILSPHDLSKLVKIFRDAYFENHSPPLATSLGHERAIRTILTSIKLT